MIVYYSMYFSTFLFIYYCAYSGGKFQIILYTNLLTFLAKNNIVWWTHAFDPFKSLHSLLQNKLYEKHLCILSIATINSTNGATCPS